MKLYQMLCLIIVGILYNISFWTYFISHKHTQASEVEK